MYSGVMQRDNRCYEEGLRPGGQRNRDRGPKVEGNRKGREKGTAEMWDTFRKQKNICVNGVAD
jgi:hypothetical protein